MHLWGSALLSVALVARSNAQQFLATDMSFGQHGRSVLELNPAISAGKPNFNVIGEPGQPQIFSNKVILTPPAPGQHRGAIWATSPLMHTEWSVDVDFRATGPERGGGKFQVWLAMDGENTVGTSSIYTVGKFDGLGLLIDTYGGTPGVIRGFLNDGRTDYKNHHSVDSLAFGHCGYAYRNLGRPSQLKIRQTSSLFKVEIDGDICFESANIKIPEGYFLGISAVSADIPDSYEVFRMVTMTDKNEPGQSVTNIETNQQALVQQMEQLNKPKGEYVPEFLGKDNEDPPEISADQIKSDRQFADLHDRLQATFKHVSSFQRDFDHFTAEGMIRNNELLGILGGAMEQMKSMEERLKAMEKNIETIKYQVGDKDYLRLHTELKQAMQDSHSNILAGVGQSVKNHAPSMGWFLFLVLGFQGVLAVSYVAYKRQRANSPKKYL